VDLERLLAGARPGSFIKTAELERRTPGVLPTGIPELDELLGGGFPAGRITELAGRRGGRTALAHCLATQFTVQGKLVALVDGSEAFDARSAAGSGMDLNRLLWVRPTDLRSAVRATDALLSSGLFPLVLFDLPSSRGRQSIPATAWVRIAHETEAKRVALLVLGNGGNGGNGGVGFNAAASLTACQPRFIHAGSGPGRTLEAFSARVELTRNKLGLAPGSVELAWRIPDIFPVPPGR
jgi:hypothetical protein